MEKLNKGNRSINSQPFNEIYEVYTELFNDLFQSRLIVNNDTYIHIPYIEKEIIDYINSGAKSICILTGLTGIGKSSVLSYINSYLKKDDSIYILYVDLLGRRAKLNLGEDFYSLDNNKARLRAANIAELFMIDSLIGSFSKDISDVKWGEYFYDYMIDNNMGHLVFSFNIHNGQDSTSKKDALNKFKETNPLAHAYAALKYYCYIKNKKKVVIILDNTDQKDFELIEAFVDILSDFTRCIGKEIKSVTPVVSCRPYNEKRLQKYKDRNSLSTHGSKTIPITKPCSLSEIILSRYKEIKNTKEVIEFITKKGIKWSFSDVDTFIENLTKRYEEEGLDEYVIKINNYNLSTSLENTLNILKNKYFISIERLLPSLVKESKLPYGLSRSAVLKSLAYGNPSSVNKMYYPHDDSDMPIPNLLNWNTDYTPTFLSKFRIIQYLIKRKAFTNTKGIDQEKIVTSLYKHLAIERAQAVKCLNIMYYEKLIFTHNNREPNDNSNDYIVVSPKALIIFQDSQLDSLYTEFWFDDTPVNSLKFRSVLHGYPFSKRPQILIEFIEFIWSIEEKQLSSILKTNITDAYIHDYGSEIISAKLLNGVEASIISYYKVDDDYIISKIEQLRIQIAEICNKFSKLNFQDILIPTGCNEEIIINFE